MPGPMIKPGYRPPPKATTWREAVLNLLGNPANEVMLQPWMGVVKFPRLPRPINDAPSEVSQLIKQLPSASEELRAEIIKKLRKSILEGPIVEKPEVPDNLVNFPKNTPKD